VHAVHYIQDVGIFFWYNSEKPEDLPSKRVKDHNNFIDEMVDRPPLKDTLTIRKYLDGGTDACIQYINKRIATYLLDMYENEVETLPQLNVNCQSLPN